MTAERSRYPGTSEGSRAQVERREAAIGTGICADCGGPAKLNEGLCLACREPRRSRVPEAKNPYKKVWNTVEDEESYILASVRSNTLFVPTPEILAERHRSTARYWRKRAESEKKAIIRRAALKEAVVQDRLANEMKSYGSKINSMKRPADFFFTVTSLS